MMRWSTKRFGSKRRAALGIGAAGLILLAAVKVGLHFTSLPPALLTPPAASAEFVDREGRSLRTLLVEERRYARPCALADVSPHLLDATLSAEDRRFRHHRGVDFLAAARAGLDFFQGHRPVSGASTITQQLIKIANPGRRTWRRKLAEIWLAFRLEQAWSKERILTEYLNRLDYGNLQTGIAAASRFYFGKPPSDLSLAESALLAGLPKAPGRLNPHANLAQARERSHWILRRMLADGRIDPLAMRSALAEPLLLRSPLHDFKAPHFVDLLLTRRGTIPAEGGAVRTTVDLALNRLAEQAITENLRKLTDQHATAGAVVVIDNPTGDVLALACAATEADRSAGDVNTAWMVRSPGSAMKPFTYLLALERGANPCTVVPDVPTDFSTPDGVYRPNNYNHRFYGPVSLRFALGNSLNVAAIRALELAGGPEALQHLMKETGVTTLDHPSEYYGLGLTLGNGEVRLLELANAFATLGRLGLYRPFRLLLRDGAPAEAPRRIMDAQAAYLVSDMLSDNAARVSSFGLTSYLAFDFPVAGKTGTSSDYRDNWCLGYTPEFTVGVWVGNPDGTPMQGITGVTGAAPIMHELMQHLHDARGTSWFASPAGVASYAIDPLTGRLAPPHRPGAVQEKCLHAPEPARSGDYDAEGRVRLPETYAAWLAGPQNNLGSLVSAGAAGSFQIIEPVAGSIYYLDHDLPAESQWIPLRASGGGEMKWSSASLAMQTSGAGARAQLREGRHTLSVRDSASGKEATTWIEVKPW